MLQPRRELGGRVGFPEGLFGAMSNCEITPVSATDRPNGLGGEILQQFNLFVGEGAHLLAIDGDDADQLVSL